MLNLAASQRASAQEKELNEYLWVLLAVANLVDVLASRRAFQSGTGELNPIVDLILADQGVLGIALFKAFWLVVLWFLLPYMRSWTQKLFVFACLAYFCLTLIHVWYLSPLL